jgi:hypothetical protein
MLQRICLALYRTRFSIATIGLCYLLGVLAGLIMVTMGNRFSLSYRDRIVGHAQSSAIIVAAKQGNKWKAAALDSMGNLGTAVATTLSGYCVVFPYASSFHRGWVGGIVSVDQEHRSRLQKHAFYYVGTMLLQLVPYILAGGSGVNIGLAALGPYFGLKNPYLGGALLSPQWLKIPLLALTDAGFVYLLVVPLFLFASAFEFYCK